MPTPQILVVDPSLTVRHLCAECCRSCGAEPAWAEGVGAALSYIEQRKPHAVLTALELPGLFGGALIAALKASPSHRAIPIGLVTSSVGAAERLGSYGPDRVLLKNGELQGALRSFLGSIGLQASAEPPATIRGRVLLVEDVVVNQLLVSRLLHVAGADVVVANNGAEALDLAEAQRFDLILMDIEMPIMDGREAVATLRRRGVQTPVLAMTALDVDRFRPEAERLGFNGVLAKTADRQRLLDACGPLLPR